MDSEKVQKTIERMRYYEPEEGYYLAFSGGKDSIVLKELANSAGVKYDAHYNVTTIDPPDLLYFIRQHHPDVVWEHPERPFLRVLEKTGFPMRQRRWCCEMYKERGGSGRLVLTGIRAAESPKRAQRRMVEHCAKDHSKNYLHPLMDWSDEEIWEFIRERNISYCSLYDEGWKRIGCLLCPMAGHHRYLEAEKHPRMVRLFIKAFENLYQDRKSRGKTSVDRWENGAEMFWWWLDEYRGKSDTPRRRREAEIITKLREEIENLG